METNEMISITEATALVHQASKQAKKMETADYDRDRDYAAVVVENLKTARLMLALAVELELERMRAAARKEGPDGLPSRQN